MEYHKIRNLLFFVGGTCVGELSAASGPVSTDNAGGPTAQLFDGISVVDEIPGIKPAGTEPEDDMAAGELPIASLETADASLEVQLGRLACDRQFLNWVRREIQGLHNRYDIDAEDVVQAVLARMMGRDIDPHKAEGYAYVTAHTIIVSLWRHGTTITKYSGHRADHGTEYENDFPDYGAQDAMYSVEARLSISPAVRQAIQGLPWRQRQAVVYCYYAGLGTKSAAEIMGISRATVKVHCFRGLAALRTILDADDQ